MTPIVNPFLFYLMGMGENLWGISIAALVISAFSLIVAISCYFYNFIEWKTYDNEDNKEYSVLCKKIAVTTSAFLVVSILLVVCIPRKQTVIEMMIANAVTADNIGAGVDAIKNAADYVVEAIKSLQ